MQKRLTILLVLMVGLPLAAVTWIGAQQARDQQQVAEQRFHSVLREQLQDTDRILVRFFDRLARELASLSRAATADAEQLRETIRRQPRVRQIFLLDPEGMLVHPAPGPVDDLSAREREFLVRAAQFLQDKDLLRAATAKASGDTAKPDNSLRRPPSEPQESRNDPEYGWHVWYYGRGLELVFWHRRQDSRIVGIELERARWMADLIAELPATAHSSRITETQQLLRLVDSNGQTVYQWGSHEPPDQSTPLVDLPTSHPLASWRLQCYISDSTLAALSGRSEFFNRTVALAAVAIALITLGFVFYRESTRELREAATRVNFVNQVSHELKTPLTNIRMYADLLERDLQTCEPPEATAAKQRLEIIVGESQRLSRLINNVLVFSQHQRSRSHLQPAPMVVDSVIDNVLLQFEPVLRRKEIEFSFEGNARDPISCDADALEQILINLFSNVEKYAANGGRMDVSSSIAGNLITITVSDRGPGIPANQRERVFQPFFRTNDSLEGTAGTGIGLTISRNLARQHHGELRILASDQGTVFCIELLSLDAVTNEENDARTGRRR